MQSPARVVRDLYSQITPVRIDAGAAPRADDLIGEAHGIGAGARTSPLFVSRSFHGPLRRSLR